jgi:hypothetical protein
LRDDETFVDQLLVPGQSTILFGNLERMGVRMASSTARRRAGRRARQFEPETRFTFVVSAHFTGGSSIMIAAHTTKE